jgi:uncharacterized Fe-S cluster-containing protein
MLMQLGHMSNLSAYTEIINAEKYSDFVVFVHIACPSLFFSSDSLELFDAVASGLLFVCIFRDLVSWSSLACISVCVLCE